MRGLDPRIHGAVCAGFTMDCRVKPGNDISDVCGSGFTPWTRASQPIGPRHQLDRMRRVLDRALGAGLEIFDSLQDVLAGERAFRGHVGLAAFPGLAGDRLADLQGDGKIVPEHAPRPAMAGARSEEHTSELQSLMR